VPGLLVVVEKSGCVNHSCISAGNDAASRARLGLRDYLDLGLVLAS
jgi:hypothetical protein